MNYEVALFDADGTLFDFHRAEAYALERAFRDLGIDFHAGAVEEYKNINQEVWQLFERGEISSEELRILRFERFRAKSDIEADAESLSRSYLSWLSRAGFLIDGAVKLIEALSGRVRLAIITNGLKDVQRGRFGRSSIQKHFDAIVISEEVGVQKPDPSIFEFALESIGHTNKRSVLMIGDSLTSDIQGGVNFGIDTCWYNPGNLRAPKSPVPRHVVSTLEQLLPICLSPDGEADW